MAKVDRGDYIAHHLGDGVFRLVKRVQSRSNKEVTIIIEGAQGVYRWLDEHCKDWTVTFPDHPDSENQQCIEALDPFRIGGIAKKIYWGMEKIYDENRSEA